MAYWEDGHSPAVIFCLQARLDAMSLRNGALEVFLLGFVKRYCPTDHDYDLGAVMIRTDG